MYTQIETVSYFLSQSRKNNIFLYTFFILGTYHLDILYLCEQGREDPWIFYEAKRVCEQTSLGNIAISYQEGTDGPEKN
jgi:hypothetical protein